MIGWIEKALQEKKHDAEPIPASLFAIGKNEKNGVGGIEFDLMPDESHGLDFDISEHPVDNGSTLTDHIRLKPRECTVTGMFTCHPIKAYTTDKVIIDDGQEALSENRALTLYKQLETLSKKMGKVRLVTDMITYPTMLIKSLKTKRDKGSGESITFTMTLREFKGVDLNVTNSDLVITPSELTTDKAKKIAKKKNAGRKSAASVTETKIANNISSLQAL